MPTINELLGEEDVIEKTASQQEDDLEKLAAEIGLTEVSSGKPIIKEARMLQDLYQDLFPGDDEFTGQEKTAAAIEEEMGAYAYDVFVDSFQNQICKIATALVDADGQDETHPYRMDSNEDTSEDAIDTDPEIQDDAMGTSPRGAVGHFEMTGGIPKGEQIKKAALAKHLLMAELGLN